MCLIIISLHFFCHIYSSSSFLLPLSVNVFILSRWLYWHYHNESQPRGEPRLLKIIVAPEKTFCNRMLWKAPKKNFSHQIQKDESWFLNGQNFNPVNPILWITKGCKINVFRELEWRFIINDLEEGTEYQQVRPSSASKWVIRCFLFLCSSHSCF